MSIYQCTKCGCGENTACSAMSRVYGLNLEWKDREKDTNTYKALASYKTILGIKANEEFRELCSACSVLWFTEKGAYGIGKPSEEELKINTGRWLEKSWGWHGKWKQSFFEKGKYSTGPVGNLVRTETGKETTPEESRDEEWPDES